MPVIPPGKSASLLNDISNCPSSLKFTAVGTPAMLAGKSVPSAHSTIDFCVMEVTPDIFIVLITTCALPLVINVP